MPSLVAFRRKWNIGSDDFVFPEITEAFIRITWVTFGISVFVFHFPLSCSTQDLNKHLLALLFINLVTIFLAIFTALISARGTIMDSNRRKLVTTMLYFRLPIFIAEIAVTIFSTIYAFQSTQGDAGCHFSTLVRITIVLEWALIATAIFGIIFVFHLTDADIDDSAVIAQRSWSRRMKLFKIGQDDSMRAALDEVAMLISTFFVDSDLVFSDVLAGLLLAYHSPHNQYPPVIEKQFDEYPKWMNLQDAEYYLHHATCVYGWPTYLMYNFRVSSCCRLFRSLQFCGKMRCEESVRGSLRNIDNIEMEDQKMYYKGRNIILEDNCCYCNTAAVVLANEQRNMDLAFMSFRNRLYEVPFAVIADHEKKAIVVTIRGSCSLMDLVTDLCLEDELLTIDVDQDATLRQDDKIDERGDVRVHRGMLRGARYVFDTLNKHTILSDLFVVNPEYDLIVCGHSLGAGVGSLLTMLLKQEYPNVRCFAYAPPGCVISEFGQDEMEKHVMSIVAGDDIVSRISYQSLHRLREKIMKELVACKRAKFTILIRGVYQMFFKYPWEDEGLSGVRHEQNEQSSLDTNLLFRNSNYGGIEEVENGEVEISEPGASEGTNSKIQLYAPGRIVYLAESDGVINDKYIDPKCLSDIKLSVSVFSDHLPAGVQRLLKKALLTKRNDEDREIIVNQPV